VFSKQASSATKMGEIMSMGVPFVTNRGIGDSDILVEENEVGVLTELGEYREVVKAIENLSKFPIEKIREVAIKFFSLRQGIAAYDEVYQMLTQSEELTYIGY